MRGDCDTPANCCCVNSNNSCENIDCGICGLTASFLPPVPIAALEKNQRPGQLPSRLHTVQRFNAYCSDPQNFYNLLIGTG